MSSTLYTVGTALRRAHDNRLRVALLVETHWLRGQVAAIDGHGVLLDLDEEDEHSVVRLESVAAVRVHGSMPPTPRSDDEAQAQHVTVHASLQPA